MLVDSSSKQSFTTVMQETRIACSCSCEKQMIRQKLEQILSSLYEDISAKQQQIQKAQKASMESIREKQDIIQRLVSANSKLVIENQALYRRLAKTQIYSKSILTEAQTKFNAMIKQMSTKIAYLQQRNEFLKNEIRLTLSYIPQDLLSYQITPKAPRSRCSNQNNQPSNRETRYSHISHKSPSANRLTSDISSPRYGPYLTVTKNRKKYSDRTELGVDEDGFEELYGKRSKSSVSRQECSVEGR